MLFIITGTLALIATLVTVACFIGMLKDSDADAGAGGLIAMLAAAYLWWATVSIFNFEERIHILENEKPSIQTTQSDTTQLYKI